MYDNTHDAHEKLVNVYSLVKSHMMKEDVLSKKSKKLIEKRYGKSFEEMNAEEKIFTYILNGYRGNKDNRVYDEIYKSIMEEVLDRSKKAGKYVVIEERVKLINKLLDLYRDVLSEETYKKVKNTAEKLIDVFGYKDIYENIINRRQSASKIIQEEKSIVKINETKPIIQKEEYNKGGRNKSSWVGIAASIAGFALMSGLIANYSCNKAAEYVQQPTKEYVQQKDVKDTRTFEDVLEEISNKYGANIIIKKENGKYVVWIDKHPERQGLGNNGRVRKDLKDWSREVYNHLKTAGFKVKEAQIYKAPTYAGFGMEVDLNKDGKSESQIWLASYRIKETKNKATSKEEAKSTEKYEKKSDNEIKSNKSQNKTYKEDVKVQETHKRTTPKESTQNQVHRKGTLNKKEEPAIIPLQIEYYPINF